MEKLKIKAQLCAMLGLIQELFKAIINPQTSYSGDLFDSFALNVIHRKIQYQKLQYKMSYLQTVSGVEIDLILDRPSKPFALVEIKSTQHVREDHVASLIKISA